jgi:hypothetical protein
MIDLDKIEAAATAATPGPWVMECGDDPENWSRYFPTVGAADIEIVGTEGFYCGDRDVDIANATHIATANPATVLEMVSMIRERDAVLRRAQEALEFIVGSSAPMTGQQEQCWPGMKKAIAAIKGVLG